MVLLYVSIAFFSTQTFSQSYSVPSPTASQMTRYNGVSLNESSGRVTTSIPVYNYQVGGISVPVSLNYVGNGVKIDQHSNWVGTNWLLDAGGVVTRVVNHIADETAINRLFAEDNAMLSDVINNGDYIVDLIEGNNTTDDLRPDLFSFSFPGYSGSFYLDKNNVPRLMKVGPELLIELANSPTDPTLMNTIVITTPNGLKYYFGGDSASESSSTLMDVYREPIRDINGNPIPEVDLDVFPKAITAFYLYKIEHPLEGSVFLEYHDDGDKEYLMFRGEQIRNMENGGYFDEDDICFTVLDVEGNDYIKKSIYKGKIYNRKKISRIYSNNSHQSIEFNSSFLTLDITANMEDEYYAPEYDDRVLNSIDVYDSMLDQNIKHVELDYITTTSRIFLESVTSNNDPNSTNKCSVYRMEYDEPESLPVRFSTSQDMLGYYNHRNNQTVIPIYNGGNYQGHFSSLADRFVNFEYAKKGSLSKIYHPTGGYTSFEYEAPKVKANRLYNMRGELYRNQSNRIPETSSSRGFAIGGPLLQAGVPAQPLAITQTISVNVSAEVTSGYVHNHDRIYLDLKNVDTGEVSTEFMALGSGLNRTFNFNLQGGYSYVLIARIDPLNPSPSAAPFTANINFVYENTVESDGYGIRVKRILEYPEVQTDPIIKRYYYKRAEKALGFYEDEESAVSTYTPKVVNRSVMGSCCNSQASDFSSFSYLNFLSNPFAYFFASADNQVSYRYVTVSLGGDFFEAGGIEKKFRIETSQAPEVIRVPDFVSAEGPDAIDFYSDKLFMGSFSDNNAILNGAPLRQTHIKNDLGVLYKVKETEYNYAIEELNQTEGIILISNTLGCGGLLSEELYQHSIGNYNNFSYAFNLIDVSSKEYIGDELPPVVPPTRPDPSNPNPDYPFVSNQQVITYNDIYKSLPKTVTTTDSDGSEQMVKNYYLNTPDLNTMSGLTTDQLTAYNTLIGEHRIAAPIQVETYYRPHMTSSYELTSKKRVLYKTFVNTGHTLPEHSQGAKLNLPLETQMTYHKYDEDGYPLEVSAEDDIKKSVIYGYNDKKVIAELVNQSYDAIPQVTIDNLHALSNAVVDETTQNALESALDQLRMDYPEARINTYVYNKLGQLSSKKDNRGYRVSYVYDSCYRLLQVKDQEGNIIEEHDYNVVTNN